MKFSIDSMLLVDRGWGIICSDRFNSELTNIFFRPNSSSWPTIVLTRRNYSDSQPILSQAKIYWSSDQTEGVILEAWFVKRLSCIHTRWSCVHTRWSCIHTRWSCIHTRLVKNHLSLVTTGQIHSWSVRT